MSDTSPAEKQTEKQPLPPGIVLGPDGKPCKICTAFRFWKPRAGVSPKVEDPNAEGSGQAAAGTTAAAAATVVGSAKYTAQGHVRPENCPPDVEQLGRATWTFLHTTAAYYPEKPTPTQRANMLSLIHSLPVLYPCTHCATHLGENVKANPPDVSSRYGLSRWLCERHNDVNERLRKKKFDCAITNLDERWKDGPSDGSCD